MPRRSSSGHELAPRLLSGADHDRVDVEHLRLAVDRDVQAGVVDAARTRRRRACRRRASSAACGGSSRSSSRVPRRPCVSLRCSSHTLRAAAARARRLQPAALAHSRRRCPTRRETPRSRDRRRRRRCVPVRRVARGQELGDVEADAARADDRHACARACSRPLDDVDVARDLRMVDARRSPARAARCPVASDHVVEAARDRRASTRRFDARRRRRAARAACGNSAASRRTPPCRECAARG